MKHPSYMIRFLKVSCRKVWRKYPEVRPVMAFVLALMFFAVSSISDSEKKFTTWFKKDPTHPAVSAERFPANDECSDYKYNELQLQNKIYQSQVDSHNITGQWMHLNYKDLSFPQVRFLQNLSEDSFASYKSVIRKCSNVSCVLSEVSEDNEYGDLVWNWFLKTGIVIQWGERELQFTKPELKRLWTLSNKLTKEYFHQPEVTSLVKGDVQDGKCFSFSKSQLILSPNCEDISLQVTVGLTHVHLGKWLAQHPSWKNILLKTSYTPHWKNTGWSEDHSSYEALTHEVASFIHFGQAREMTKSFIKETLFKKDWSIQGEMNQQFKIDQWVWRDIKNKHLKDCIDLHKYSVLEPRINRGIASLSTPHPLAQCVRQTANVEFLKLKRSWLLNSSEACSWQKPQLDGSVPASQYFSLWKSTVEKDIDQLEWKIRAQGPKWLKDYQDKEKTLSQVDPTWVYFDCHNGSNPKGCYKQGLSSLIQSRAPSSVQEEILDEYPYEALQYRVRHDLGLKRQWLTSHLEQEASKEWRKCWSKGPQEMAKIKKPLRWVTSGTEFIDAKMAYCLDDASEKIILNIKSLSPSEKKFWQSEMNNPLKLFWKKTIAHHADTERRWIVSQLSSIKSKLSDDLKTKMNASVTFEPKEACMNRVSFHYPNPLYFHNRAQLSQFLGSQICKDVLNHPDMQKSLSQHRENRWNTLGIALKSSLVAEWDSRVRKYCLGRIPASQVSTLLETESMKGCIRDQFELAWPISANEVGLKFSLPGESLDEFKDDIKAISQAVVHDQLRQ